MDGSRIDARAVVDDDAAAGSGVAHAETLLRFADAVVADDEAVLEQARRAVLDELGAAELVDAAAVASNFERMVRIADGTGIPLDGPLDLLSEDLREELGLGRFAAAGRTPPRGGVARLVGALLRPATRGVLRLVGRVRRTTSRA